MKILQISIIPILFLGTIIPVFAFQTIPDTNNSVSAPQQIKFNSINDIVGPSGPILTAELNKLNYEVTDRPIINILGPPSSTLNLIILDHSGKEMHSDKIAVGPDGLATYSINLTSFTPGVYSVVISRENIKVVKDFAVGLPPSGPRIDLLVPKPSYIPNEILQITGFYQPNTIIHLDLIDPNNIIKNSTLLQSDNIGNFQKKFVIPSIAVNGTWEINATSGLVHSTIYITVSSNYQENQTNPNTTGPPIRSQNSMTPLQQFKSGIVANDVKCEQGLQLVIKSEDGSSACVKPETVIVLVEHRWATNQIGVSTLAKPSIGLYNVTTSLQPIILGMSFFVNAEVVNNQNTPITYYGGCISPLSISFNNIQTHTNAIHCLAISKYVLGPYEQISIQSDKINSIYNGTGPNYANAELKFQYENNGTKISWFTSAEFPIQHAIKLNCGKSFQSQIEEINKSVNIQKAIALAHRSPKFLSKVKRYGNVSYMSFYNDLFPDQSCNAYWKGIEVMFTANDKNGVRNIQVSEDINLTKVIKIEDFQAFTN